MRPRATLRDLFFGWGSKQTVVGTEGIVATMRNYILSLCIAVGAAACGNDDKVCKLEDPVNTCKDGLVCESVDGKPTCSAPVVVRGHVVDGAGAAVSNALVTAVDVNDAPVATTSKTDVTGAYEIRVPVARVAGGAPMSMAVKLHAAASAYDPFPAGIRQSFPIELSTAVKMDKSYVVQTTATEVTLFAVANPTGLGSIAGTVKATGTKPLGALIVAEGPATLTSISDSTGSFTIFNAPAGAYTVRGYVAGLQLSSAMVTVAAGAPSTGVDLVAAEQPFGTVTGNVNIVNPGMGNATSVVLVVASTFNDTLKRGEVPPGLRAPKSGSPNVTGAFTIENVPDGHYRVLAAFENDYLVRDPDTSISGTAIPDIMVSGGMVAAGSMKITGSLDVISPGAGATPEVVTGTPTFKWKDDSSEDLYKIELFDAKGTLVWMTTMPGVSGGDASIAYAGPALTKGVYYQFRVTSSHKGTPISQTEDLKGIFIAG